MSSVLCLKRQSNVTRDGQLAVPRYNVTYAGLLVREECARICRGCAAWYSNRCFQMCRCRELTNLFCGVPAVPLVPSVAAALKDCSLGRATSASRADSPPMFVSVPDPTSELAFPPSPPPASPLIVPPPSPPLPPSAPSPPEPSPPARAAAVPAVGAATGRHHLHRLPRHRHRCCQPPVVSPPSVPPLPASPPLAPPLEAPPPTAVAAISITAGTRLRRRSRRPCRCWNPGTKRQVCGHRRCDTNQCEQSRTTEQTPARHFVFREHLVPSDICSMRTRATLFAASMTFPLLC